MHAWTDLLLPFAVGIGSGSVLVFFYFRSRLRIYKYLIEQRLSEVNERVAGAHASARERINAA